nr:MAG TPA: hypothetical protein [Caudoviricetes sp.]
MVMKVGKTIRQGVVCRLVYKRRRVDSKARGRTARLYFIRVGMVGVLDMGDPLVSR